MPADLQKEGHVEYHRLSSGLLCFIELFPGAAPDEGMDDGIELLPLCFVCENQVRHLSAIQRAIFGEYAFAKSFFYFLHSLAARRHRLAGQLVPINDGNPQLFQIGRNCTLSAAHAAG